MQNLHIFFDCNIVQEQRSALTHRITGTDTFDNGVRLAHCLDGEEAKRPGSGSVSDEATYKTAAGLEPLFVRWMEIPFFDVKLDDIFSSPIIQAMWQLHEEFHKRGLLNGFHIVAESMKSVQYLVKIIVWVPASCIHSCWRGSGQVDIRDGINFDISGCGRD
jgi:hypothetical protein